MTTQELVKNIKKMRVDLDKYFTIMGKMLPSREISITITSTQNAKMWLGQTLKALGESNPYPDSKDARNKNIAPTADVYVGDIDSVLKGLHHIQQVKVMRQRLSSVYEDMQQIDDKNDLSSLLTPIGYHSMIKSWEYVIEANMWLGMELGRINNECKI